MKISYNITRHHPTEGTVYRQTLRVTHHEYQALQNSILAEIAQNYPQNASYSSTGDYKLYLKPLFAQQNHVYTNNTQARYIKMILMGNQNIYTRFKTDVNTCIIIRN